MTIPATTKDFIDSLIDYYISEASSYKQFAYDYAAEAGDVSRNLWNNSWLRIFRVFAGICKPETKTKS